MTRKVRGLFRKTSRVHTGRADLAKPCGTFVADGDLEVASSARPPPLCD